MFEGHPLSLEVLFNTAKKKKKEAKMIDFLCLMYQNHMINLLNTQCLTTENYYIDDLAPGLYFLGITDSICLNRLPHLGVCWLCVYRDPLSISLPSEVCGDVTNV